MASKQKIGDGSDKRITLIATHIGLQLNELSAKIGMSDRTLYNITGGYDKISRNIAESICNLYPQFSFEWVFKGEGPMLKSQQPHEENNAEPDIIFVPVINLDARAGFQPNDVTDTTQAVTRMMPFGREYAQQGDFVVPVYGESMSPTYPSGSLVLARNYERWREYIDYGSTYIVELDDGTRLIKIVTKSESEDKVTLHSINSTYTDNDVPITIIRRMYRVILTIRQEAM